MVRPLSAKPTQSRFVEPRRKDVHRSGACPCRTRIVHDEVELLDGSVFDRHAANGHAAPVHEDVPARIALGKYAIGSVWVVQTQ